jgi:hypothetical protein
VLVFNHFSVADNPFGYQVGVQLGGVQLESLWQFYFIIIAEFVHYLY